MKGRRAFVACARSNGVSVVDLVGGVVVMLDALRVGLYPSGLALDAGCRRLYCGCALSARVAVVDLDSLQVVGSVAAEAGAGAVAIDSERSRVYCANFLA